jgi:hypothetical protein
LSCQPPGGELFKTATAIVFSSGGICGHASDGRRPSRG